MTTQRAGMLIGTFFLVAFCIVTAAMAEDKPEQKADPAKGPSPIGDIRIIRAADLVEETWTLENYHIDTGDVLEISVWQVEELQKTVVVRPDGKISFPLIGDIVAGGRTIEEVSKSIAAGLSTYIKEPKVSAIITSFGGKKIVVLGEVANQGIIRFTEPIRIMEVLALSGGYAESAGLKTVLVIRGDLKNHTDVIVVLSLIHI